MPTMGGAKQVKQYFGNTWPWFSRSDALMVLVPVLFFFAVHQFFLVRADPDALYMDSLRLLFQLDQWQEGKISTFDFWGGSSHRGFVNQLFLLANVHFFDLDVFLANRLTGVVIALVATVIGFAWLADFRNQSGPASPLVALLVPFVFACVLFSWAGYELLTLDLGLPLWTKNLVFVLFYTCYANLLSNHSGSAFLRAGGLALAAPLIILVFGMGWNYAFVGALLVVQTLSFLRTFRTEGRWLTMVPAVSVALSMLAYLSSGSVTDASTRDGLNFGSDVPGLFLYSIGSSLGYPQAILGEWLPLEVMAVLGALVMLIGLVAIVSWVRRGAPGSRLPLLLVLYGVLVAVSVTLARGAEGPWSVMASRYYMDLVLGLVGVVWLVAREMHVALRYVYFWRCMASVGLVCVLITQSLSYAKEWKASPYRAAMFDAMNQAVLEMVPDQQAADLLQSPLEHARWGSQVMRERGIGVFSETTIAECSTPDIAYAQGWHAPEGSVRWSAADARMVLPPCGCSYYGDLYIPPGQQERTVVIDAGDQEALTIQVPPGEVVRVRLGTGQARLRTSPVHVPSRGQSDSMDTRELGVLLAGVSISCEAM